MGNNKSVIKNLDFLTNEFGFEFIFQTFEDYYGFCGPIDAYSFFNEHGCFTLHHIVQKGEWGWFTSSKFSTNQYDLVQNEINQSSYISKKHYFAHSALKELAIIIKNQILTDRAFFGIKI